MSSPFLLGSGKWAYENPRRVRCGSNRAAGHKVPAVGQVDDFGVALRQGMIFSCGDVGDGGGGGQGQQEGDGGERLHREGYLAAG